MSSSADASGHRSAKSHSAKHSDDRSADTSSKKDGGGGMKARLEVFDQWQQKRPWSAITLATVKKFSEDQSTNMASMIAFWAFFSIFPLLLAMVTILAYVLPGQGTRTNVLQHVASFFPLLDTSTVHTLSGSAWTLIVGLLSALWSGLAVVKAVQTAFNSTWEIPYFERPKFVEKLKRGVLVLFTIGLGLVLSTIISSFVTGTATGFHLGWFGRLAGYVIAIALDVGLFIAAFRMLTDREISTKDVLPGALTSGIVFWILEQLSAFIVSRHLQSASSTYGNFATVITILWWFYLQGQVTMLGAQLNVVLKKKMWPRSLIGGPDTEADHRTYKEYAKEKTYHESEEVDASFRNG